MQVANEQQEILRKRLPLVIAVMVIFSIYLVGVLASRTVSGLLLGTLLSGARAASVVFG